MKVEREWLKKYLTHQIYFQTSYNYDLLQWFFNTMEEQKFRVNKYLFIILIILYLILITNMIIQERDIQMDKISNMLDIKITEVHRLKQMLNSGLVSIHNFQNLENKIKDFCKTTNHLNKEFKEFVNMPNLIKEYHSYNIKNIIAIQQKYNSHITILKSQYQVEIIQLEKELQKQYNITKRLKQEVLELKRLIVTFNTTSQTQNKLQNQSEVDQKVPSLKIENIHNDKNYLESIMEVDEGCSTKRQRLQEQCSKNIQIFKRQQVSRQSIENYSLKKVNKNKSKPRFFFYEFKKSISNRSIGRSTSNELVENTLPVDQFNYISEEFPNSNFCSGTGKVISHTADKFISNSTESSNYESTKHLLSVRCENLKTEVQQTDQIVKRDENLQKSRASSKNLKKNSSRKSKNLLIDLIRGKQDKYKTLINNLLNAKQKENGNAITHDFLLFVGDKKSEIKYQGSKKNNQRNGKGVLFYSNGFVYEGYFKDNERAGYGILKFNQIQIYNGDWQNDMLNGQGKIKYVAALYKNKKQASHLLSRWTIYCGQFKNNRFDGLGTLILVNNQKFMGNFSNGSAEGQGTYYNKSGQISIGMWKNNVLVQKF